MKSFFDLPDKEKKEVLKEATVYSNKEQMRIIKEVEKLELQWKKSKSKYEAASKMFDKLIKNYKAK